MVISQKTEKLLKLYKVKGVGPAALEKILLNPQFDVLPLEELLSSIPKYAGLSDLHSSIRHAESEVANDIEIAQKKNVRIISVYDSDYPSLLKSTRDRPFFLYIKGQWPRLLDKMVAVIGTRHPTKHGAVIVDRITEYFVDNGWSIVSGLALGCDGMAHRAALLHKGHTVAVLAHGLNTISPKQHTKLADEIVASGGALITEYSFNVGAVPHQFVKRDRIQAGLSRGVIMIQSDLTGGSLHASRAALEYRRVLAIPYPTRLDIELAEEKIQANLLLCSEDIEGKMKLLRCEKADLDQLKVLHSKEDYPRIASDLDSVSMETVGGLF